MGHVVEDLIGFSEYVYGRTRERLADLTDEEWAWEPADWCWSVRRVGDGWLTDYSQFPVAPTPITTIAWRLDHVIANYGAPRNGTWFGLPGRAHPPVTGSAVTELARLDDAAAWWHANLRQLDEVSLAAKLGPIGGEWADYTRLSFVHHEIDEQLHHGAEIGVLRDLYAARATTPPSLDTVAAAATAGRWDRVVELVEAGADANGGSPYTALHLAIAARAVPAVKVLLDHGADRDAKDGQFHMDALGWARYFQSDELVALLG